MAAGDRADRVVLDAKLLSSGRRRWAPTPCLLDGAHIHPLLQVPEHVLDLRQRRAQVVGDLLRQQVRLGQARRILRLSSRARRGRGSPCRARGSPRRCTAASGRRASPPTKSPCACGGPRGCSSDELVEVGARHALGLQREVLVGAQVVDPDRLGPRLSARRASGRRRARWP